MKEILDLDKLLQNNSVSIGPNTGATIRSTRIVFVDYAPKNTKKRDIYLCVNGYTVSFRLTSRQREIVKKSGSELDVQDQKELSKSLNYCIIDPNGRTLKFIFEHGGKFTEINRGEDSSAQKSDWIEYDKDKFITLDKAVQVNSYLLTQDVQGDFKIRKTVTSQGEEGGVSVIKTATLEDRLIFDDVFFRQILKLYSVISSCGSISPEGGVMIYQSDEGNPMPIDNDSKDALPQSGVCGNEVEEKSIEKHLESYEGENPKWGSASVDLIPKYLLKDIVGVETHENAATTEMSEASEINTYEYLRELFEMRPSERNAKLELDCLEMPDDAEKALNRIFDTILGRHGESTQPSKPNKRLVAQNGYKRPKTLILPNGKTIRTPFRKTYSEEYLKGTFTQEIKLGKDQNGNEVVNKIVFNHLTENLSEFQFDILAAYFTEKKENPQAAGVTFLDLANDIYHSRGGGKLESRDKLVKEVEREARRLIHTPLIIDFRAEIDQALTTGQNSRRRNETRDNYRNYLANGGVGIIETNLIQATAIPIRKSNGVVLDGLSFSEETCDNLLWEYIELSKQYKRLPAQILSNPLKASRVNVELHNYLSHRLTQMPYFIDNRSFLAEKLELLKRRENGEVGSIRQTLEYEEACRFERSLKPAECTIRVDTIKSDLKLTTQTSRLTRNKLEPEFEYLKKGEIIEGYVVNYDKNGRSVESYTIHFFCKD